MRINNLIYFILILPGFIIFIIFKSILIGFAKNTDTFDKTLYCLAFNLPIFAMILLLLNNKHIINIIESYIPNYNDIYSLNNIKYIFFDNILSMLIFILIIILSSIVISILFLIIRKLFEVVINAIRQNKIYKYRDVWCDNFVKSKDSIPAKIYDLNFNLIGKGFISEASEILEDNIEFKLIEEDAFNEALQLNILEKEFTYINTSKNLKIVVFKIINESQLEGSIEDEKT